MDFSRLTDPQAYKDSLAGLLRRGSEVSDYIDQAPAKVGQTIMDAGQRQSALMNKAFDPTGKTIIRDSNAANQAAMNLFEGPMSFAPAGITSLNKSMADAVRSTKIGDFDPRFDPRKLEQEKIVNTAPVVEQLNKTPIPKISLADYEGRPFITSMSDRTAAGGDLLGVNDVMFKRPVRLHGGQDYMFNNPDQVWASAQNAVSPIVKNAQMLKEVTGQNPLYIPWRMAPTSNDFAHMTGEAMIANAEAAMGKTDKKALNDAIKGLIPNWKGVDNAESIAQYRSAPKTVRDSIMQVMDRDFRDMGSLNIGQARLAVTDPRQINAAEGGIMNVGEIFANKPMIMNSGHPSYPRGVAGQGLGTVDKDLNIFELLPNVVKERGIANPTAPAQTDLRALQMKPYAGIITAKMLRDLGY